MGGGGLDGWGDLRNPGSQWLSPLLVLLKAGLDAGQAKCAGTGEYSHTLGSQSPHRSLKYREDRTGESVYFQVELDSLCGYICIY